ncbi:30 kDa heat shock protein [Spathaspora sp. JA1]|nr:30 kDa heat shock protein [Spathaspora sp. JA1]
MIELIKRNTALQVNPTSPFIDIHLTDHGSSWLWAAFSVFGILTIIHGFLYTLTSVRRSGLKKALLTIPLFTNAIFTYVYYTYASNLGYTGIPTQFHHITTSEGLNVRQIFYHKFIGWFLAWPFVLAIYEVITHTHLTDTNTDLISKFIRLFSGLFIKIAAVEVFVLGLLIGALIQSSYKWGYFTFAVFAQLFAIYLIGHDLFRSFGSASKYRFGNLFILFGFLVWVLYPICWGLSEGGNRIQPDSEAVFYGILDLITFGIIPSVLTWLAIKNVDEGFFGKIWPYHLKDSVGDADHPYDPEKNVGDTTPRHSGDTAVAPAGVPTTGVHPAVSDE